MFGLEGNGFLISITITLLLAGMITFYFRQQIGKVENKLTSMFQLIQSITSELNKINDILVKESNLEDTTTTNVTSNNSVIENETTSFVNEETQSQKETLESEFPIQEFETHVTQGGPRIEIHAMKINPIEMMVGGMTEKEKDIKVIDITKDDEHSDNESESESELESDTDDETVELEVIKEPVNDENKIEIKVETTKQEVNEQNKTLNIVDYSKMHVGALREILVEKGLVTDAKKLRKKEMLELLG